MRKLCLTRSSPPEVGSPKLRISSQHLSTYDFDVIKAASARGPMEFCRTYGVVWKRLSLKMLLQYYIEGHHLLSCEEPIGAHVHTIGDPNSTHKTKKIRRAKIWTEHNYLCQQHAGCPFPDCQMSLNQGPRSCMKRVDSPSGKVEGAGRGMYLSGTLNAPTQLLGCARIIMFYFS